MLMLGPDPADRMVAGTDLGVRAYEGQPAAFDPDARQHILQRADFWAAVRHPARGDGVDGDQCRDSGDVIRPDLEGDAARGCLKKSGAASLNAKDENFPSCARRISAAQLGERHGRKDFV